MKFKENIGFITKVQNQNNDIEIMYELITPIYSSSSKVVFNIENIEKDKILGFWHTHKRIIIPSIQDLLTFHKLSVLLNKELLFIIYNIKGNFKYFKSIRILNFYIVVPISESKLRAWLS